MSNEVKRRFYLVVRVLELMDCKFDNLSKDVANIRSLVEGLIISEEVVEEIIKFGY